MTTTPALRSLHGFTLIELLVVVAIVAVLAAMLMPALSAIRRQAQRLVCSRQVGQIMLAVNAYVGDQEGLFPPVVDDAAYWVGAFQPTKGRWQHHMDSYLETLAVLNCPVSARIAPGFKVVNQTTGTIQRGAAQAGGYCLYAMNDQYWGRGYSYNRVQSIFAAKNRSAARCPVVIDGAWNFSAPPWTTTLPNNTYGVFFPHQGRQSAGFADGHVEVHPLTDYDFSTNDPLFR